MTYKQLKLFFNKVIVSFSYFVILCYFSLVFSSLSYSKSLAVDFVVVKEQGIYSQIIKKTKEVIADRGFDVSSTIIDLSAKKNKPLNSNVVVTIGTKAASYVFDNFPKNNIISALLTQSGYEQMAIKSFGSLDEARDTNIVSLYLDQPFHRFFSLGKLLVPNAKSVGVLLGPANKKNIVKIEKIAKKFGVKVNFSLLEPVDNPVPIIESVMRTSDFFIVIPDRKEINQLASKWVLPLSYRFRTPVIAYSKKYVYAGALASVYFSPDNVAATIAHSLLENNGVDTSNDFSVSLNSSVARSLGIKLLDKEVYREKIKEMEGRLQ